MDPNCRHMPRGVQWGLVLALDGAQRPFQARLTDGGPPKMLFVLRVFAPHSLCSVCPAGAYIPEQGALTEPCSPALGLSALSAFEFVRDKD